MKVDGQNALCQFTADGASHLLGQNPGDGQTKPGRLPGGLHCVITVKKTACFYFRQTGGMILKNDFSAVQKLDFKISVTVFDGIA